MAKAVESPENKRYSWQLRLSNRHITFYKYVSDRSLVPKNGGEKTCSTFLR
jgi:hypothetical protein